MFTDNLRIGWSLGNTLDSYEEELGMNNEPKAYETAWHNPITTKAMIQKVINSGFDIIRIPVTWYQNIGPAPEYKINPKWMARVKEVVDWAYEEGVYVIINTHHENWVDPYYANNEATKEKLAAVWKQIATTFADYSDKLIFEGINEPRKRNTSLEWGGGDKEGWDVLNQWSQTFVDAVRSTGGNNQTRQLMVTGYAASSTELALSHIEVPKDDNVIVSVHAYEPWEFCLNLKGRREWEHDTFNVDTMMKNLKKYFIDKGIPVILGEFGAMDRNHNVEERAAWAEYYVREAKKLGIPCVWWDNNEFTGDGETLGLFNRKTMEIEYPEVLNALMKGLEL